MTGSTLQVRPAAAGMALLALTVCAALNGATAQEFSHPVSASRDDASLRPRAPRASADTLRLLAAMVQFQQDTDTRTSGDGRFVLTPPADSVVDAPPRDRAYVEHHLEFVTDYFRSVSKGRLPVSATVVDSIFTLPHQMARYSPQRNQANTPLADLARDAWSRVDSSGLVPEFSAYDCFLIIHAGVGRDIDLVSILGYDPTPFDIPSLYLGLNAFREVYGPAYQGIPVDGGSFFITNSIIVPETESRLLPGIGGDVLLELGINGLLCASVGSYLGLPDLFDTQTGRSGIGRFGLMDGQAIFSYAGLFPPEPSAWEKYWLGWVQPVVVGAGTSVLTVPAVALADTIYRVPISATEYYLVENRNRDARRNGQRVRSVFNGVEREQFFIKDTTGFNAFDISSIAGVVTSVEEYDWSVPGVVDVSGTFYDGGILIWHIDESVIAGSLSENGVNADPARRGVDVEEADGSQDIGQSYGFLQPGSGSEEGTPLDFWFKGNIAPVYANLFSATTYPSALSNLGANSGVVIRDFSAGSRPYASSPRMTVVIDIGSADRSPIAGYPRQLPGQLAENPLTLARSPQQDIVLYVAGTTTPRRAPVREDSTGQVSAVLHGWRVMDGLPALPGGQADGRMDVLPAGWSYSSGPIVTDLGSGAGTDLLVTLRAPDGNGGGLRALAVRDTGPVDGMADVLFSLPLSGDPRGACAVAGSLIAVSDGARRVLLVTFGGSVVDSLVVSDDPAARVAGVSLLPSGDGFVVTSTDGTVLLARRGGAGPVAPDVQRKVADALTGPAVSADVRIGAETRPVLAMSVPSGAVVLTDLELNILNGFPVALGGEVRFPPALADIDGDGARDVIALSGGRIVALNAAGHMLDNFPVSAPAGEIFSSPPIAADVDLDGAVDVVGVTEGGLVIGVSAQGRSPLGFPVAAGVGPQAPAAFASGESAGIIVASSADASVSGWVTTRVGTVHDALLPWPQYQHDALRSGRDTTRVQGAPRSDEFMPASRAYNWPNPVYDGTTFIRYYLSENATVRVRIFDLVGDLVAELTGPGIGGLDNEVAWNVAGVQSGVYLARIEASGGGGSETRIVKIAVVK